MIPLRPVAGRAVDLAAGIGTGGPILANAGGTGMGRHAATRRLGHLAEAAGGRYGVSVKLS